MNFSYALLLTALLGCVWSCKPNEKAPTAPEEPTAAAPKAPEATPKPTPSSVPAASEQDKMRNTVTKYRQAVKNGDTAAMETIVADLEKTDPNNVVLTQMKIDLMLVKKDWAKLEAALVESPSATNMIGTRLALPDENSADAPPELLTKVAGILASKVANNPEANPMEWLALSSLQLKTGEAESAKKSARSAVTAAEKAPQGRGIPPAVFLKFSEEIQAGRQPTMDDFSKWLQEFMQRRPINPPIPANQ